PAGPKWYRVSPARRPNRRPAFRQGRPFRRPCVRAPAGRYRKPLRYGRSLVSSFSQSLAETAGDVVLRTPVIRIGEDSGRFAEFHELAEIHECGEIGHTRSLLHVVGNDHDGVIVLELVNQLLDFGGGDRVERRAWLVEQDHL